MYQLKLGNSLEVLKTLEENSVDSIVTDPPYELGFMGKSWDKTGIANNVELWKECLRVLKPGGHLLAFSGTRTYHRMAVAIEDAGFEVRDMIEWVYGSGFPKSLNIGKVVDKLQGNEKFKEKEIEFVKWLKSNLDCYWCSGTGTISADEIGYQDPESCLDCDGKGKYTVEDIDGWLGTKSQAFHFFAESDSNRQIPNTETYTILKNRLHLDDRYDDFVKKHSLLLEEIREVQGYEKSIKNWDKKYDKAILNKPKTELASKWEGWGTSLKPSHEPVICCAKPLTLELIFAKMGIDITNNLVSLCQKYNVNVKDVESSLNSILLKLEKVGVNTVAENARTCDWENIESVVIAGMSFTSPKPISKEPPEGYKVVSAPVSANQNGNEYLQENGTLIGTAEDLSEQMDILLSKLATRNIDLNTVWLWKSILENVLQKAGTFTTSMALKTTIAWKTYKSLLSENTPNFTSNHNSTQPAHEPICMARKPLAEKTVAQNVLKYGTGGINIDESRVEGTYDNEGRNIRQEDYKSEAEFLTALSKEGRKTRSDSNPLGRFPANLIHDNSEEVRECFPNESERFFKSIIYQAKASKKDRGEYNNHPTVKPTPLMEYLVTMVTKKGGVVLDPFNGSGSTGVACVKNGFDYIGIDLSEEYLQISEKRIQSLNN